MTPDALPTAQDVISELAVASADLARLVAEAEALTEEESTATTPLGLPGPRPLGGAPQDARPALAQVVRPDGAHSRMRSGASSRLVSTSVAAPFERSAELATSMWGMKVSVTDELADLPMGGGSDEVKRA